MKRATIKDAPPILNMNDRAKWVLGFNAAVKALPSAPPAEPSWWAASLNRRATVEQWMHDAARGKRPMPTADELRAWALKLGTPAEGEPAAPQPDRADAARFRFLCQRPDWRFIEEICLSVTFDSSDEFLRRLRAAIDERMAKPQHPFGDLAARNAAGVGLPDGAKNG